MHVRFLAYALSVPARTWVWSEWNNNLKEPCFWPERI